MPLPIRVGAQGNVSPPKGPTVRGRPGALISPSDYAAPTVEDSTLRYQALGASWSSFAYALPEAPARAINVLDPNADRITAVLYAVGGDAWVGEQGVSGPPTQEGAAPGWPIFASATPTGLDRREAPAGLYAVGAAAGVILVVAELVRGV